MPEDSNFAGRLVGHLSQNSHLTDAVTGQVIRGGKLADLIVGFASAFTLAGLQPGDRIVIGCGLNTSSALAYLGAIYCGLVVVPLAERDFSTRGELVVARAQARAIWVSNENVCEWASRNGTRLLTGEFPAQSSQSIRPAECDESDLASLMLTSGSTGIPQLVKVTHGNLLANTQAIIRSQYLATDETAMLVLPISYCYGASVLHTHLWCGGGVVFDSRFMFPDKVLWAIGKFSCTTFAGVPSVYNILLRRSSIRSIPMPNLRRFLQAGGPLAPERINEMHQAAPQTQFYVMYGQTEATARISCLSADRLSEKLGSVGLPLDNLKLRVVDDLGRELPNDEIGEIQVQGPSVCSGYFNDAVATRRKFEDGWLKTGDFGSRDEAGYLWIKGRQHEFIKMRGIRVGFAEVEAKTATIPGICECAATAVEHPEAGEALALFVVADTADKRIAELVRRALPPEWTCASVNVVSELPKTASGKIARDELQAKA